MNRTLKRRLPLFLFLPAYILPWLATHALAETSRTPTTRLQAPPLPSHVRVLRSSAETIYLRVPSPGFHYDDLLYDVKIRFHNNQNYLHASLRLPNEPDDLVTLPYVRLLDTNFNELCFLSLSNATLWCNGGILKAARSIPPLPYQFFIACGYAFYRDTMYMHAQGGPYETIVDTKGRIRHRGPLRSALPCHIKSDQPSDLIHVGESLHLRPHDSSVLLSFSLYHDYTARLVHQGSALSDLVISPKLPGPYLLALSAQRGPHTVWRGFRRFAVLPKLEFTDDPAYFGRLAVNDSIACGLSNDHHFFIDGRIDYTLGEETVTDRLPGSALTNIWYGAGRVIAYDRGFIAYTIGLNLKRGQPYLLEIQYPEDLPRTMAFVIGNGSYAPGIHTGHTLPQPEPRFFSEQIMFPLSKQVEKAQFIVWPGERDVRDGLRVGIADPGSRNAPFSHKPLVLIITLYDMLTIACPRRPATFPPHLQRYAWTEMERPTIWDEPPYVPHINSIFYGLNALAPNVLPWNNRDPETLGVLFPTPRYIRYVRRRVNDVELETTQQEDARHHYNFFADFADRARKYHLAIFPIFEYGGTDLLPSEARAVASNGLPYSPSLTSPTAHEVTDSADVYHPATQADAEALINDLLKSLTDDQKGVLRQLILRRRANFLATAYNTATLQRFVREYSLTPPSSDPSQLREWILASHHDTYRRWYQSNLLTFAAALQRAYSQTAFNADGPILYYHWRHSGMPFEGLYFQTDERWTNYWQRIRSTPFEGFPLPTITPDKLLNAVHTWTSTEDGFFTDLLPVPSLLPVVPVYGTVAATTLPYAQLFRAELPAVKIVPTLSSPARVARPNRSPLAAGITLYHSREHIMYDALLAFVSYNPRYLAFDQSHPPCFPAPETARRFILNFLALPALPLQPIPQSESPSLFVAAAQLDSTNYLAIANTSLMPLNARVRLPRFAASQLVPLVGKPEPLPLFVSDRELSFPVSLAPLELRALRLDP